MSTPKIRPSDYPFAGTPTATPRTDAHVARLRLDPEASGCDQTLSFARELETELAATRSERDLAITRVASILRSGAIDKHICGDVRKWVEDWSAELGDAKQEAAHYMSVAQKATDELARLRADNLAAHQMACAAGLERDRFRAELAVAENWVEHHSKHADDLIGENVKLRAEVERLTKQIKDDSRSYGCELRDPNGTIWEQAAKDRARAERAEAERDALRAAMKP